MSSEEIFVLSLFLVVISLGVLWAVITSIMRRRADRQFRQEFERGTVTNEDVVLRADRIGGAEGETLVDEVTIFFSFFYWLMTLLLGGRRRQYYIVLRSNEILLYDNRAGHDGVNFKNVLTIPRAQIKRLWFRNKNELRLTTEEFVTIENVQMESLTFKVFKYKRRCGNIERARKLLETNYPN